LNTWRNRRRIGKDGKPYKWSYYPSEGYYVGFKLIAAIDAENYELLDYELHDGCPNDAKILIPFLEKLYPSKKMRMGDLIICDKGSSSMKDYIATINRFFVVPIIYQRKNTNMKRILANYGLGRLIFGRKSDVNFLGGSKSGKHSEKSGAGLRYYSIS